jgi:hypothetical protein
VIGESAGVRLLRLHAFNEFHYNIHHSGDPVHGNVATLGPQDGASGLHNGSGAEVIGVPGCG